MKGWKLDRWLTTQRRVAFLSAVGTAVCIAIAFAIDSYSLSERTWTAGNDPWKNVVIPAVIAPPFFYFLLTKVRQLAIARHRLEIVASTDSLTSCLNRAAFSTLVEAYLAKFENTARGLGAMLVVDLDHFKRVNDKFGHAAGDEALKAVTAAIRSALREVDLIGRIGGEEFCVFLPGARPDHCAQIAERIRSSVEQVDFKASEEKWPMSVSIGGATFSGTTTFSELFRSADRRLYEAKRAGRNQVVIDATDACLAPSLQ